MQHPLDSLLYITISSEKVKDKFPGLDPAVPLPVQHPEGDAKKELQPEKITEELILAGMLLVFAYDRENAHFQYYRKIFDILRPDLRKNIMAAAILKTKNGDFDAAEELFLALEGLNPNDRIAKLNLALLAEERSAFFEASDLFEKAKEYEKKAHELYDFLIAAEPPLPAAFFNAAYFFIKQKNYRRAKSLLQTYLQIENAQTEDADVRKEKAEILLKQIEEDALDDRLFEQAHSLIDAGDAEQAVEKIKLFLRKKPKVWNAWFLLGWALRLLLRWQDSKASFLQALELLNCAKAAENASFSALLNELAICNTELGLFDEAKANLIDALRYKPDSVKTISNLGALALKRGEQAEAESFFAAVLELNPGDKIALNFLKKD